VNDNVLANLYAASDVLFFPSRAEGFGSPMVESLSSGLPVVASDIPITREVLGDAGIFAEKDDPFQYADLIRNSIMGADKEANKCLERSVEFSFDVFRKRYLNLYENLLGKTAPIEIR
jgi:glycosyltransferase involved in cell wall biosynthesis